jgi:5-methylcytosine-specific restriction protein A
MKKGLATLQPRVRILTSTRVRSMSIVSSPLYRTTRWLQMRANQLTIEPLCRMCRAKGLVTAATVADHIEPHRGDERKFWEGALQSLCASCHSSCKQSEEVGGWGGRKSRTRLLADRRPPHLENFPLIKG